jgi:hypothetical protein
MDAILAFALCSGKNSGWSPSVSRAGFIVAKPGSFGSRNFSFFRAKLACYLQPGVAMKKNQIESLRYKLSTKPFVVQYAKKRFLAYRDAAGRIRHFWKQTLLPLPVHILDPES